MLRAPLTFVTAALLLAAPLAAAAAADTRPAWQLDLEQIMADPDWIGPPVEQPYWSLDGRQIVYSLKREGSPVRDLWRVSPDGGAPVRIDDDARATLDAADPVYDAERRRALFVRSGDVFLRDLSSGELRQLTRTPATEARLAFSSDGGAALWQLGRDWWSYRLDDGLVTQLTDLRSEKDPQAEPDKDALRDVQLRLFETLRRAREDRDALQARERELRAADPTRPPAPTWLGDKLELVDSRLSPDRRYLLLVLQEKSTDTGRAGKMPKYVTESGYEEVEDVRTRVGRNAPLGQQLQLLDLADGSLHPVSLDALPGIKEDPLADLRKAAELPALDGARPLRIDAIEWTRDGSQAALMLRAIDNKDRWLATVDFAAKQLENRHRLTDPGWINWSFNAYGWLPGSNDTLWLQSEHTGFAHLYTLDLDGRLQALTSGDWEADNIEWAADGATAWFTCNRRTPGDYELCSVDRGSREVRELTALDGVEDAVLSPDGQQLALTVSAHHTPPQLAVMPATGGDVRMLTDTRSAAYRARDWLAPQYVKLPSKHGADTLWAKFYRPQTLEPGKRYPIVLFVHGAGYLQNVHARWPTYFREQMFHELLVEHGYLVLDIDYRGSAGYGRDWRTAIYRQMGHPELEDYLDGIDWLVDEQQGDRDRVGIYGGSYGGFMTFMAMFRAPEQFHAGAALRPVTDWTQYNHEYTSNILNTPAIDPAAYLKSSPIEYASGLQGELLISHGMIDDNVFYQDSVRLAQRLIELRKDGWELASYPLERHAYQQPESWYDQYRRVFELFRRTLQP